MFRSRRRRRTVRGTHRLVLTDPATRAAERRRRGRRRTARVVVMLLVLGGMLAALPAGAEAMTRCDGTTCSARLTVDH